MYSQLTEELTMQFYTWEQRGRGWDVWSESVQLEPPFVPFYYYLPELDNYVDEGRKPTILSKLVDGIKSIFQGSSPEPDLSQVDLNLPYENTEAAIYKNKQGTSEIRFLIPQGIKINLEYFEQCLLTMSLGRTPISFEIVGLKDKIYVQFSCPHSEVSHISQQLKAYFPDSFISINENTFQTLFNSVPSENIAIIDFGLSEEFMRPLRSYESFIPDPLTGIFGVMEHLSNEEVAIFQIIFNPVESS